MNLSFLDCPRKQAILCNEIKSLNASSSFDYSFDRFKQSFNYSFPLVSKTSSSTKGVSKVGPKTKNLCTSELENLENFILLISDPSKRRLYLLPKLRRLKREYRTKVREAKQAAEAITISESSNPCNEWDYIKKRDTPISNPVRDFFSADDFNSYLLESVNNFVLSYEPDHPNNNDSAHDYLDSFPFISFNFSWHPVDPENVISIVRCFKTSSSKYLFDISIDLLKKIYLVAPTMSNIVYSSLKEGVIPKAMTINRTVPVYKKVPKDSVSSYRPILLIQIFAMIFEATTLQKLYVYFEE